MSYIEFDKRSLVNLEHSLQKELIRSNRAGGYACTTLSGCNTRKYHGLLIVPDLYKENRKNVLLSNLDETIIQNGKEFRLGIHEYENMVFVPHGHRYIVKFETDTIPAKTYSVGGVILKKEMLFSEKEHQILIRYTIEDAHSPTTLRLQPFTVYRNIHELTKENFFVNQKKEDITNGIKIKMYDGFPYLFMQTSKKGKFITAPDWNKNVLYREERNRGYEYTEDLFTYGYFELKVKKGDKIIFSAGLKKAVPEKLNYVFNAELKKRIPRDSFEHNIKNSAEQFFIYKKNETKITAGFPWYDYRVRETLLSLTGLTLPDNIDLFEHAFDTLLKNFLKEDTNNTAPDIPLLILKTLQEYTAFSDNCENIWKKYRNKIFKILRNIKKGKYNAYVHDNGMLYIPENKAEYTWMNEFAYGKPVTPRSGFVSEVNSMWYNALMYLSALAEINNSKTLKKEIGNLPEKIKHFFKEIFINEENGYLYDYVNDSLRNDDIRPNAIFSVSLPYSPLENTLKKNILKNIKKHLLTEKGLRTLSPRNRAYKGKYFGNENDRNAARHQGTVHPWLTAEYCGALYNLYGEQSINEIKKIYFSFENEMNTYGIGTISELFDGDPPFKPKGAISYAPSVAALLKIKMIIDTFEKK